MSLIIAPNGLNTRLKEETLSRDEVALVAAFTAWCERRRLAFDLICKECYDAREQSARCVGDNDRDDTSFKINCAHATRVYNR